MTHALPCKAVQVKFSDAIELEGYPSDVRFLGFNPTLCDLGAVSLCLSFVPCEKEDNDRTYRIVVKMT